MLLQVAHNRIVLVLLEIKPLSKGVILTSTIGERQKLGLDGSRVTPSLVSSAIFGGMLGEITCKAKGSG